MIKGMIRRTALALASGFVFALALVATPFVASAATLAVAPSSLTVNAGSDFTVNIIILSPDQAINAASGQLSFSASGLRAIGISKEASMMNLWVQNPSFSNAASGGTVNFAGVVLNPGWTGADGTVISVEFQALTPGTDQIAFATGTVLANDGSGTDVLTTTYPANITVVSAPPGAPAGTTPPVTSGTAPSGTAEAPTTSTTTTVTNTASSSSPAFSSTTVEYFAIALLVLLLIVALLLFLIMLYLWLHRSIKKSGSASRDRDQLREDLKHVEKDIERLEKDIVDPKE